MGADPLSELLFHAFVIAAVPADIVIVSVIGQNVAVLLLSVVDRIGIIL